MKRNYKSHQHKFVVVRELDETEKLMTGAKYAVQCSICGMTAYIKENDLKYIKED